MPIKGLDEEEKELLKVNNGEDIQAMRKFIADLPPVRSQEELLGKEERIVILERGVQEEMNSRAERSAIRGGGSTRKTACTRRATPTR